MAAIFKKATVEALTDIAEELRVRQASKLVLLFSMGSQFDHLIVQQLAIIRKTRPVVGCLY